MPKETGEAWWTYCEIRESQRSLLVVGAWRAQVHQADQAWRVFCYSCTAALFSNGSISTWRVMKRFFAEFFSFLFDNISWCYFVFVSLFPYSCALHLLFVAHVYALEQYWLIAHMYCLLSKRKHKITPRCVVEEEIEELGKKPLRDPQIQNRFIRE